MFRTRKTFPTSAGSRRSVSRPAFSLQPNYYIEYVIAACAFFGKPNLNLILCSFCSSEVTWSALSNLLKEYSVFLFWCDRASWQILIIKPNRCTNVSNLFWNETLHVSNSSFVHHQEFFTIHSNGICHTGLLPAADLYDMYHCSESVTLLVFSLQKWVHQRASMLRPTYIACLVCIRNNTYQKQ